MKINTIFFQHPIGLWEAEPYASLRRDLGPYAETVYWRVFEQIRLGRGIDSLDHILTLFNDVRSKRDRERWLRRLRLMLLPKYNLFNVSQQRMVTIIDHTRLIREQNRTLAQGPSLFDGMEW